MSRVSCFILMGTAFVLGILSGIAEAILWTLGFIPTIRDVLPYAVVDALLIFGLTTIIALFYRGSIRGSDGCPEPCRFLGCLVSFVRVIMISAGIFLIFAQILVGTVLPLILKIIFAFIGSISFWVMFLAFIALVIWIARRR